VNYYVLLHPAEEGGFWTEVPALSGCFSQGETVEEALANTKDAIECHLWVLREDGAAISADEDTLIARIQVAA